MIGFIWLFSYVSEIRLILEDMDYCIYIWVILVFN